ncbi:nucleotidyltransferase family protein [Candidatus Roizmanbacteria bacterium]|nr:nucleotidyltransferase family protein [Candidatus Roizmanbacteria bacterium]
MDTVKQVQNKEEILMRLQNQKETLGSYGVAEIGLFGSFVRSEQTSESDIDLLVKFDKGKKTFRSFMQLAQHIEAIMGRKVEMVTSESLSPYIAPHIQSEIEYVQINH